MAALALVACKTQLSAAPAPDAAPVAFGPDAAPSSPPPSPAALEAALDGEWERRTEPYKGLRIRIRDASPSASTATVTRTSLIGSEPDPVRRAQLECQRSLWKPGDDLVSGLRPVPGGWEGTMLVRDWGFDGQCRHHDTRAPARVTLPAPDTLAIAVTRGKTVTQQWKRVE